MSRTTSKLGNANDSYTLNGTTAQQSTNYSTSAVLALRTGGTGGTLYSYVYFGLPAGLRGSTVVSATLRLRNTEDQSGSRPVTLKKVTQAWYLSKITWKVSPTVSATDSKAITLSSPVKDTEWAFDVTSHLQAVADGTLYYGWRLEMASTALMYFYSSQNKSAFKPVLDIVWSTPPSAPSQLSPSGNRAVSVDKPTLRFNFGDATGSTSLTAVQVQINTTNTWTSPVFDSGTVATDAAQLDLTATAYAGLAANASVYWRVRTQDDIGQWSPWSAAAQFKRLTKGTLVMDNPPIGGNVTEPTPPILWTFTGRTQKAYQVYVKYNGAVVSDSGKVTGTTTSYTVPAGVIKADGMAYVFGVRIWDDQDREVTPNDPAWVEITRTANYVFDATTDPVSSVSAVAQSPNPGVRINWSRATAPDSFVLWRDGKIVYATISPALYNTGSTTYSILDPLPSPRKNHGYIIQAVVNGKASLSNPVAHATPEPRGIWLSDPARNINVCLLGVDEGTWSMREDSAVFAPLGGSKSHVVTQSLGGYEGQITGLIMDYDNVLCDVEEQKLWDLKSTPGATYVLTLSNVAMNVVISNLEITPTPAQHTEKKVSFKFYAQDLEYTPVL